ncbi:hypothetical protein LZ012_11395 [Dechloromonas sp. XY25]|uniref:DUF4124 domain-containing protein n=1 Tax=Dechloromonas hankyongensis TaxID=2908002 RepID=A0ABS9K340_9RHOO|nr:hypothetical protein [Dechloromonas hankyongensis]MCG2577597.1 hypothetical protein [Dechloromonas hankyongensis]
MRSSALLLLLSMTASASMADAYRCIEGGKVTISNVPCVASKVVRSDNPSPEAISDVMRENARQEAYLAQREKQHRDDQAAMQRHAAEVARMYPQTPEPVKPSSPGISFGGCGLGGSCPTTSTRSR